MELSTSLLTDFVKKLRILDQEFRSTQAAQSYVETECVAELTQKRQNAEEVFNDDDDESLEQVYQLHYEYRSHQDQRFRAYEQQKDEARSRLEKCRLLLAVARNASRALVSGADAIGVGPAVKVELEELMSGKTDLIAMAAEVNTLLRDSQSKQAKTAAARFSATRREAERLLTAEAARLEQQILGTRKEREGLYDEQDKAEEDNLCAAAENHLQEQTRRAEEYALRCKELAAESRRELESLPGKRAERVERITSAFTRQFRPYELEDLWREARDTEPNWDSFRCAGMLPEKLYLAGADFDLSGLNLCRETMEFLEKQYPFLVPGGRLSIPWGLDLAGAGNYEFKYTAKQRPRAVRLARDMAVRMLAMMPPGKLEITFVDPVTLGESFAQFGRLAGGVCGDANGRIWSSTGDVERRLADLTGRISQVTQRCLQGRYANLAEYNRDSGSETEGFRVLMLMDCPGGLSETALKSLDQIVRLGPKCGVFTMVWRSEEQMKKLPDKLRPLVSGIRSNLRLMELADNGTVTFDLPKSGGRSFVWRPKPAPDGAQVDEVLRMLWLGM